MGRCRFKPASACLGSRLTTDSILSILLRTHHRATAHVESSEHTG
jgi:hypothetical protein